MPGLSLGEGDGGGVALGEGIGAQKKLRSGSKSVNKRNLTAVHFSSTAECRVAFSTTGSGGKDSTAL